MTEPSPEAAAGTSPSPSAPGKRSSGRTPRKADKKPLPVWQESILLLGIALVLAIGIKFFFIQAFYIPSPSMEPAFVKNDRILVQKVSYWFGGSPSRGDIVVFKDPGSWLNDTESNTASTPFTKTLEAIGLYPSGGHLVKRVIGVGGDSVDCDPADAATKGRLTVNGKALDEGSYLPKIRNRTMRRTTSPPMPMYMSASDVVGSEVLPHSPGFQPRVSGMPRKVA